MRERILNLNILIFSIILVFSLLFRITNLNLIEFKTDEAVNLLLSAWPSLHHTLPPGGTVSSIGILNPPFFNYLLSPLTFFTLDPKIFSLFIALLNSFAIAFFYLIVKKYYGQIIALTSGILFALSPWAIIYSRKIWEQDLIVPFFVVLFYSTHKILKEQKQIFWISLTLSSFLLVQLHQVVILFILLAFSFFTLQKIKLNLKYILIGGLLGLIPLLPYLGYEIKSGYPDIKAAFSSQNKLGSKRSLSLFLRPLEITGQGYINFELGPNLDTLIKKFPLMKEVRMIFYFEYILIMVGAFICVKKLKPLRFLSIPTIILPLLYFLLKIEPFMHYYIIILPILFIFLGVSFEFLFNQKNKLLGFISLVLFLSLVSSSFYFDFSFFSLLKSQGSLQGDYGSSLNDSENHIKHKNYDEAFLYQFIPLGYYFGYNPFAKMIYGDISPKIVPSLEERLQRSNDNQAQNELLAYYTKEPPNLQSLDVLRKKFEEMPQYSSIYNIVLEDYMAKNYKKQYISNNFDFTFFYPQHWKVTEGENITVEGDYLTATIQKGKSLPSYQSEIKSKLPILGEEGEKTECKKNNHTCGVYYIFKSYSAVIKLKGSNEKGSESEINAFDELLRSLRYLGN